MSDVKEIRFITPDYKELFRIPDGGHIVVTRPEGEMYPETQEQWIGTCKYLDDYHTEINGNCYHICQFAEIQQEIGSVVKPLEKPEIINGYQVYEKIRVGQKTFTAGRNPQAKANRRCVTWQSQKDRLIKGETRYFPDKEEAWGDLLRRADGERRGVPYRPARQKNGGDAR